MRNDIKEEYKWKWKIESGEYRRIKWKIGSGEWRRIK